MSTTRTSKTPTAASFLSLTGLCVLLAAIAATTVATSLEYPAPPTEIGWGEGGGEGEGPSLVVMWALVIGKDGVARCQLIQEDWKRGDPVPPADKETADQAEIPAEVDDAVAVEIGKSR